MSDIDIKAAIPGLLAEAGKTEPKDLRIGRAKLGAKHGYIPMVAAAAERHGFKLLPSAQVKLKNIVTRCERVGTVEDPSQGAEVAVVLTAAGIEAAQRGNTKVIGVPELIQGWNYVRMGSGNCPPHRCVRTSVISRSATDLSAKVPFLETFVLDLGDIKKR